MSSKILAALLLVGGAGALYAGPVYSCGGGSACDGNLYAVWVVSQTATSYVLDVGVQVTSGYTGSTTDYINALSIIPDNSGSATGASLTGSAAGMWSLRSGSSTGPCNGVGAPYICAGATGMGANLFSGSIPKTQIWQFTITGTPPSLGDTANVNFHYINYSGNTVGGSGSFDIGIQCIGGGSCDSTSFTSSTSFATNFADPGVAPEPVTSALIGAGLVGLYFLRRRFPRP